MEKYVRVKVEVYGEKHMKVREEYAKYDTKTRTITGFGKASSCKYEKMEFEPTFEAVLYNRRNEISGITQVSYNGVFTKTGMMYFGFKFDNVEEYQICYIKLRLIAKTMTAPGQNVA